MWFLQKFFATPRSRSNDICNKKALRKSEGIFFSLGLSQKNYGNTYEIVLRFLCKIKIKIPKLEKIKIYIPILDSGACATLLSHLSLVIF